MKETPKLPENFFLDETPKEIPTENLKETDGPKPNPARKPTRNDDEDDQHRVPKYAGKDNSKSDGIEKGDERNETPSKPAKEMTFEEEWQSTGGGGNNGKSGNLKADGDLLTRRGVKRGPRKKPLAKSAVKVRVEEFFFIFFFEGGNYVTH